MGNTINLGRGYSAEVFEGIPDQDGYMWEAFLLFDGELADNFEGSGMFATAEDVIVYLKEMVLPRYVTDNKIGAIRGLTSPQERFELVNKYIKEHTICYGSMKKDGRI